MWSGCWCCRRRGRADGYTGFAVVLFSGVAVAALFVLRAREPRTRSDVQALGYPVAPAIFVVASLLIVVNAMVSDPLVSGTGALIILAGVPIYMIFARRASHVRSAALSGPRSRA